MHFDGLDSALFYFFLFFSPMWLQVTFETQELSSDDYSSDTIVVYLNELDLWSESCQ